MIHIVRQSRKTSRATSDVESPEAKQRKKIVAGARFSYRENRQNLFCGLPLIGDSAISWQSVFWRPDAETLRGPFLCAPRIFRFPLTLKRIASQIVQRHG